MEQTDSGRLGNSEALHDFASEPPDINNMLWKRQPTRANEKTAHVRPSVARNGVRAHFGAPRCDSTEKVLVGDTPACSTEEKVSTWCLFCCDDAVLISSLYPLKKRGC